MQYAISLFLAIWCVLVGTLSTIAAEPGFESIFNGHDLNGWAGAVDDYEVIDGSIVCKQGRGGVLFTEAIYDDFVVKLEFKVPPGGNNGLAIRYPGSGRASYDGMCELQVLDDGAEKYGKLDPRQYHGSVYGMAAAKRGYLKPVGEWNSQTVTVIGPRIQVELNGVLIVDADVDQITEYKDDRPHPGKALRRGHFGFAGHNDPVLFRNLEIKRLPAPQESSLPQGLLFHADFDHDFIAKTQQGYEQIQSAATLDRKEVQLGEQIPEVSLVKDGRLGGAVKFSSKSQQVLFYSAAQLGYRPKDWSGTISVWMKLDPDADLEPGYCDPIQFTPRAWNDACFFVDFDKDLPRAFRLGVFPDIKSWNPRNVAWDDIASAARPMITVERPDFSSESWTHVCMTWEHANSEQAGLAKLYLNGKLQGSLRRSMHFTWSADEVSKHAALMLGIYYVGLMDDLRVYDHSLSEAEIRRLASAVSD